MARTQYPPGQMPLFIPASSWTSPAELPDLSNVREVAIDTETNDPGLAAGRGPAWHTNGGYVAGVSAAWAGGNIYIPLKHPDSSTFGKEQVANWLQHLFRLQDTRFIFHNANYDLGFLQRDFDVPIPRLIDDTAAMAAIVDENRLSYRLDALCAWQGLPGKDEALLREAGAAYFGTAKDIKAQLWRLPAQFVGPYAEADAAQTLALAHKLRPLMEAEGTIAAYQLEADLIPMTLEMRRRGIRVDVEAAERLAQDFEKRRDARLQELSDYLGHTVRLDDVRSKRWLQQAFDHENLEYPRTAATEKYADGQASFESSWMRTHKHPLPRLVAQAKHLEDMANKFLRSYIIDYAHKGRIHATVNQFRSEGGGTRSHRMSYSDPPLQQIPSRDDELAPLIRGVFLPEEGEVWAAPDYNQQEYRLIVHFAELLKLPKAVEAGDKYRNDPRTDFHQLVVEMTGLIRRRAKDVNFAKSYGAGRKKFAEMTGMSLDESDATMKQYDQLLPFVKAEGEACERLAQKRGWIKLLDKARSHFEFYEPVRRDMRKETQWLWDNPRGRGIYPCSYEEAVSRSQDNTHPWYRANVKRAFTHKAMNRLVQGSAARQTKLAMRAMWREGIVPLLQMHDEIDLSVGSESIGIRAAEIMRAAAPLTVPMLVDVEYGATWGRAAVRKSPEGRVLYGATFAEAVVEAATLTGGR